MGTITKVESEIKCNEKGDVKSERRGHTRVQWTFAILASTTLFTYGLLSGWISPMSKVLKSDHSPIGAPLTDYEMSWVGSTLALTATFGVPLYAYIADVYGRKFGVIAIAIPQAIAWGVKVFATNTSLLLLARILAGIPAAGCYNLVPMYVKEISQNHIRGAVVAVTLLLQNLGILIMYVMGAYMEYYTVLYVVMALPVLTSVLMIFAPESPAFLVKVGKYEEAAKATAMLRSLPVDDKEVQSEVEEMKNEDARVKSLPDITFKNVFKNKANRRGFLFVFLLMLSQASGGAYVIMTYALSILSDSGVTFMPEIQSLLVPILMIFGSMVSMACVEKMGRKKLLIVAHVMTTASMATLGAVQLIQSRGGSPPGWLSVVPLAVSVFAYSAGIAPILYVVMAEIFSFQVRAKLIGCLVTIAWFTCYCQLAIFSLVSSILGMYTMFFVYACINAFGFCVSIAIPETRGKTVPEIEKLLLGNK